MKWLRSLFGRQAPEPLVKWNDPDFGPITFDGDDTAIWQSDDGARFEGPNARYGFSAIPGDQDGPFPWARTFLVRKKQEIPALWALCTPSLEAACERWKAKGLRPPVENQFTLNSLSLEGDFASSGKREVGFEARGDFWMYVAVRVVGDRVEGFTCHT
ncbi:MAG TPA: hypothetical protein VEB66_05955 [Opitutaceae bacterium]|nr:hypothetical protein [Opitutaceae bacterium]